jgi:uronate dehydrogenase
MKKIPLTGAAGGVGTLLRDELRGRYQLRLSDKSAIDACAENEEFIEADLGDLDAIRKAVNGVDGIIHLGGYSVEGDWETTPTSLAHATCSRQPA